MFQLLIIFESITQKSQLFLKILVIFNFEHLKVPMRSNLDTIQTQKFVGVF